jgi:hypothetical protein
MASMVMTGAAQIPLAHRPLRRSIEQRAAGEPCSTAALR